MQSRSVDAFGLAVEHESRARWERSTALWWRRERWQLEVAWWGAVATWLMTLLAGVSFVLAGILHASETRAEAERELRGATAIRQQNRAIMCRAWPKECRK